jgi:hypothetical protein
MILSGVGSQAPYFFDLALIDKPLALMDATAAAATAYTSASDNHPYTAASDVKTMGCKIISVILFFVVIDVAFYWLLYMLFDTILNNL